MNKMRGFLGTVLVLSAFAACIAGCSGHGSAVTIAKALSSDSLNPDTKHLLETVANVSRYLSTTYALPEKSVDFRYLSGARAHLAWELVTVPPASITVKSRRYFTSEKSVIKARDKATAAGLLAVVNPLDSVSAMNRAPSPVFDAMRDWPYERIVEWTIREALHASLPAGKSAAALEGFETFETEQVTLAYLYATLNGSSPVVARYISEKRDERTFASLFPDFRSRFETLYSQKPLPADVDKTRDFLASAWLQDYALNYPSRFLTNKFRTFGKEPVALEIIAAWVNPFPAWQKWESAYRSDGEDPVLFYRKIAGTK